MRFRISALCLLSVLCLRRSRLMNVRRLQAGLFCQALCCFEGVDLRLIGILLYNLIRLAGTVFKDGDVLQVININSRNNEIYT